MISIFSGVALFGLTVARMFIIDIRSVNCVIRELVIESLGMIFLSFCFIEHSISQPVNPNRIELFNRHEVMGS